VLQFAFAAPTILCLQTFSGALKWVWGTGWGAEVKEPIQRQRTHNGLLMERNKL
jgi:hypothetical protein